MIELVIFQRMQSVVRAASLGQLARASASAVPAATGAVKEVPIPAAAPSNSGSSFESSKVLSCWQHGRPRFHLLSPFSCQGP